MHAQAKYMKANWLSIYGGEGRVKFMIAKKRLDNVKDLNTLIASGMENVIKINNKYRSKDK